MKAFSKYIKSTKTKSGLFSLKHKVHNWPKEEEKEQKRDHS